MRTENIKTRFAYALPAFALAIIGIPVYVYIPKFYTDVVGIDIAVAGIMLFGVRLFDAITDPVMGTLSDRTQSRFGRRRPYIMAGSVLVAIALFFLFNPPEASSTWSTVWFAFWIYALFLFWTLVTVPYEALGPEITFEHDARTTLFAWRDGFLIAGTLAAAASPALVQAIFQIGDGASGERTKFFWIAVIYAPLVVVLCAWCVTVVRERHLKPVLTSTIGWRDYRTTFENRPLYDPAGGLYHQRHWQQPAGNPDPLLRSIRTGFKPGGPVSPALLHDRYPPPSGLGPPGQPVW